MCLIRGKHNRVPLCRIIERSLLLHYSIRLEDKNGVSMLTVKFKASSWNPSNVLISDMALILRIPFRARLVPMIEGIEVLLVLLYRISL